MPLAVICCDRDGGFALLQHDAFRSGNASAAIIEDDTWLIKVWNNSTDHETRPLVLLTKNLVP